MAEHNVEKIQPQNQDNKTFVSVQVGDEVTENEELNYRNSELATLRRKIDIRIIPPITLFFSFRS